MEYSYYTLKNSEKDATVKNRRHIFKILVFSIAVGGIFGLLVASNASGWLHTFSRVPVTRTARSSVPALAMEKSFTTGDSNPIYAETWDEAEHIAEKRYILEEMERRKKAHLQTFDFYTENWDGDVYVGPAWNIMTVLGLITLGVPLAGLVFAYMTYGTLWSEV